jgi:D-threo-aldose 1-dehydrogenase
MSERVTFPANRLGMGTAPLGGLYDLIPESQAVETVTHALERGITLFDTAPHYGAGLSEQRLGLALEGVPRDSYTLATKVGRLVDETAGRTYFDFSRDGILRNIEASLTRLRVDRIDILHVHDPDEHLEIAFREAFPVLEELRSEGVIRGVGVGTNWWQTALACVREASLDCLLLAGRYSLLEQEGSLDQLFPACIEAGIDVILGGIYNTGILATGAIPGARYNYVEADAATLDRVRQLEAHCAEHGIALADAAVQFPAAHPAVSALVVGLRSIDEVSALLSSAGKVIPEVFWDDLKSLGLIHPSTPVPASA